jgi:hypothetical protein
VLRCRFTFAKSAFALRAAKGAGVLVRALRGLGGIGKSRLAVEYAWRHEADYSALLFVRAESTAALNATTISRRGSKPRTASSRPSRSTAVRSQSTRRAMGRIIPMWRETS